MMRTNLWKTTGPAVVVALSLMVAACASPAPEAQKSSATPATPEATSAQPQAPSPKAGGELRIGWDVNFPTIDHRRTPSNSVRDASNYIHETLFNVQFGKLTPWLVDKYEFSPDGSSLTLHLHQGIKFHDGSPFNAEAVKYNLEWFRAAHEGWQFRHLAADIREVLTPDNDTVEIRLAKPNMFLPEILAHQALAIVSPAADQADPKQYDRQAAGTGPFKLASRTAAQLVLDRNPDYWGPKVYLDRITFQSIPDPSARAIALEAGDVDVARAMPHNDVNRLKAMPNMDVLVVNGFRSMMLFMNNRKAPFDNVNVRKAVIMATNRDQYSQSVYNGLAKTATNLFGPGFPDRVALGTQPYDPEKAKQLLAEAGYPNGFDTVIATSASWEADVVAQAVAADLQRVGIRAKIQSMEFNSMVNYFQKKDTDYQMVTIAMQPLIPTAWNILTDHQTGVGRNAVLYSNPEIDRLTVESAATVDPDKRHQMLVQGQEILWREVPRGALMHLPLTTAYRTNVKNLEHTQFDALRAQWAWLDR